MVSRNKSEAGGYHAQKSTLKYASKCIFREQGKPKFGFVFETESFQKVAVSLAYILQCLHCACRNAEIPGISKSWWEKLNDRYPAMTYPISNYGNDNRAESKHAPPKIAKAELTFRFSRYVCEHCDEKIVFIVKMNNGEQVDLPLSVILECLRKAQLAKLIPEIKGMWWLVLQINYPQAKLS